MNEPGFISQARIAILGLGLMGGSLALALRGKCGRLLGIDPDLDTLSLALKRQIVDQASLDPGELLPQADVVVLAAPVRAILSLLHDLPNLHPGKAVVIDLGSTKTAIMDAMGKLPDRFDPLGGHPMCGKEHTSLVNADPLIYQGAQFALIPLERTTIRGRSLALQLVQLCGATPVWIDAATHDQWTAATSHLPYLVANTLASVTPIHASPMVGPGFRSAARLAVTPTVIMLDILATNRENVLVELGRFQEHLAKLQTILANGEETALREFLVQGAENFKRLTGKAS